MVKGGYVTIRISRRDGRLKDITFTNAKGQKEDAKKVKATTPLRVNAKVKTLDRITWYTANPTCVWHNGYRI